MSRLCVHTKTESDGSMLLDMRMFVTIKVIVVGTKSSLYTRYYVGHKEQGGVQLIQTCIYFLYHMFSLDDSFP